MKSVPQICPICRTARLSRGRKTCSDECRIRAMLIDLKGERFGRLVVEHYVPIRGISRSAGGASWMCRCDCGAHKIFPGQLLRTGQRKSCGCARYKSRADGFVSTARALWDDGLSMTMVGRRLGVTKNVIAGISFRNGFASRVTSVRAPREQ